jgi:hypothetical protein
MHHLILKYNCNLKTSSTNSTKRTPLGIVTQKVKTSITLALIIKKQVPLATLITLASVSN